jgi:DNA topoisomerase-1
MEEKTATAIKHARAAGLHYVTDEEKGFRRELKGREFHFFDQRGREVKGEEQVRRIRKLAIPPAWTDVWICADPNGHLQATGRDARGRKQHRYHPRWRETRDENKFNRMIQFANALPKIRAHTARDLAAKGLTRKKVLATVVRILETGLIRVGNEEYVKQNHSFGLTTMRDRHVKVRGGSMKFEFKGKSGKMHSVELEDPRLAKIVKGCQDIPGQELFQYFGEDGERHKISSTDVNEYLREITNADFTAKDFRTWAGTVLAAMALRELEKFETQTQAKKNLKAAIERVAQRLGNTPTICRKCYIHPFVMDSYLDGSLLLLQAAKERAGKSETARGLNANEKMVLGLLKKRLAAQKRMEKGGLLKQLQASIKHRKKARHAERRREAA